MDRVFLTDYIPANRKGIPCTGNLVGTKLLMMSLIILPQNVAFCYVKLQFLIQAYRDSLYSLYNSMFSLVQSN